MGAPATTTTNTIRITTAVANTILLAPSLAAGTINTIPLARPFSAGIPNGTLHALLSLVRTTIHPSLLLPSQNRNFANWHCEIGFGGSGGGHRSSSYYKRSPRGGYIKRVYSRLRRLLRDLLYYMKRNPIKVFVLVIMPLVTGGALSGLLGRFGIRLPGGLEKMFGGGAGIGRGREGGMQYERSSYRGEGPLGGMGGIGSAMGGLGGIGGAMSLAKMFM